MLLYLTSLFYFDGETALAACVLRKKVHPGDLAGGFSDLEMTWLLNCVGAATAITPIQGQFYNSRSSVTLID